MRYLLSIVRKNQDYIMAPEEEVDFLTERFHQPEYDNRKARLDWQIWRSNSRIKHG